MEEIDEVNAALAPVEDAVREFAAANSLTLEKCPRGNAGWELIGTHPEGGTLTLLLLHNSSHGLGVGSVWQFPCSEMARLYSHFRGINGCPTEDRAVISALTKELQQISLTRFGYWTHIVPLQPTQ